MKSSAGKTLARVGLGALFLWAAASKIAHPGLFFNTLLEYDLPLPEEFFRFVALSVPWLEAICAIALIFDAWKETVRPLVCVLCATFVVVLAQAVARGLDISCGCFGSSKGAWIDRPAVALVRAVFLFVISVWLVLPPSSEAQRNSTRAGSLT